MTTSQDDLKKQLNNALKARKLLETTYEGQFHILTQFVARLSLTCKGIDRELDNRLAKLRTALINKTDLEKLLPLIEETNEILKQMDVRNQQNMKTVQHTLLSAGQQLQKEKGLPEQLRRDLRQLMGKVEQPSATILAFLPQLAELTRFYKMVLAAKQELDQSAYKPSDRESEYYVQLCQQISFKLNNLLGELAFPDQSAAEIAQIKETLQNNNELEVLLDACLKTITLIVINVNAERLSSEHFLLKLSEALTTVQQAVVSSLSHSSNLKEKISALNEQIEQQIDHLSQSTHQATSLEQLKHLVTDKLHAITTSLREKEQLEIQERQAMLENLDTMSKRLTELEGEASNFKKHLAEQTFRSLQDALTQIPNRAAFDDRYQLELHRLQRYKKPLCIAIVDIDHFKRINDNYGHSAGDKTLQVIAKTLQQGLRDTDFIARYGGEEFIMLFPETSLETLNEPLNKLREKIKNIQFKFKNQHVPITISIGATQLKSEESSQAAFDRADAALYEAKNTGRNKVVITH